MVLASIQIEMMILDLFPSLLFLLLRLILSLKFSRKRQDPDEESPSSNNSLEIEAVPPRNFPFSYYVQYKLSIFLAILCLCEILHAIFGDCPACWFDKMGFFLVFYCAELFAWGLSSCESAKSPTTDFFFVINVRFFWCLSFLCSLGEIFFEGKQHVPIFLVFKSSSTFLLFLYAIKKDSIDETQDLFSCFDKILAKFEDNFYVKILFLGKDYEKMLRKELEMTELRELPTNLSFTEMKKYEKTLTNKLNSKSSLQDFEEQAFISLLPSLTALIIKDPPEKLPASLKNYDNKAVFSIISYVNWDVQKKLEFKVFKKLSDFVELERNLNDFYQANPFFSRPYLEFQRHTLDEYDKNELVLYKKRAISLEDFLKFALLREKHLVHPSVLDFLAISREVQAPFLAYFDYLMRNGFVKSFSKRNSRRPRSFQNLLESPLLTENVEEELGSQSSCSIIPMNYLSFEIRLVNIWKFPNEPLESNVTMGISEKNINYDWEINRKFIDFITLHDALKGKPFADQPEFQANSQRISPLIQVKSNNYNYFFNFEIIKKDLLDYITFLVVNSQFHCNEIFNFIEFDPNAMKRFLYGRNCGRFLQPTQTLRTYTNESHMGKQQQISFLTMFDPMGTNTNNNNNNLANNSNNSFNNIQYSNSNINNAGFSHYRNTYTHVSPQQQSKNYVATNPNLPFLKVARANTNTKQTNFMRSFTEKKNDFVFSERHDAFNLSGFSADLNEIKRNKDGIEKFVIILNENPCETQKKTKKRLIFEKSKEDLLKLYQSVLQFCKENQINPTFPIKNIEIIEEINEEELKIDLEFFLNEVLKIKNISRKSEIVSFFHLDKIKMSKFEGSKEKDGNIVTFDFRENV